MKINILLSALLVGTIVFMFSDKPAEEVAQLPDYPRLEKPKLPGPYDAITSEKIPKLIAPPLDWDAISARLKNGEAVDFTAEEEAAFNKRHVLPLNWIDQLDCTTESCVFTMKYPPHPYVNIDKAELEELAHADPLAALLMGMRYGEDWTRQTRKFDDDLEDERIEWYLRAAALSGKTGPLMRLTGVGREGSDNINAFGVPEAVKTAALLMVAETLGDTRADAGTAITAHFAGLVLPDSIEAQEYREQFYHATDTWFQHYMHSMDTVQTEVTGTSQLTDLRVAGGDNNE